MTSEIIIALRHWQKRKNAASVNIASAMGLADIFLSISFFLFEEKKFNLRKETKKKEEEIIKWKRK